MGSGVSTSLYGSLDDTAGSFDLAANKDRGDASFKSGLYSEAIFWYSKCLSSGAESEDSKFADEKENLNSSGLDGDFSNKDRDHNISIVYSNRSASFLCNLQPNAALNDAKQAILVDPLWGKPYFRAAAAAFQLGNLLIAKEYVAKALYYFPTEKKLVDLEQSILKLLDDATASSNGSKNNNSNSNNASDKCNVITVSGVMTWGAGMSGELGLGQGVQGSESPQNVHKFCNSSVVDISCGLAHSVCVDFNGNVYAWGNNKHGQLGIGSPAADTIANPTASANPLASSIAGATHISNEHRPVIVRSLLGKKIIGVSCGAGHCIVVSDEGEVLSWGIGRQGQLGLGQDCVSTSLPRLITLPAVSTPIDTAGGVVSTNLITSIGRSLSSASSPRVSAVSCGIAHTVLLTDNGDLLAFGMNSFGQLGFDRQKFPCVFTPQAVFINSRQRFPITHVACGGAHTLLIDSNGRLFATGSNSCGQLGVITRDLSLDANPFDPSRDPGANYVDNISDQFIRVTGLNASPCAFCACGEEFSVVITQSRSVYTWGLGIAGQIGDGFMEDRSFPTKIIELEGKGMNSLSCSQTQVIAVTLSGDIYTWGLPGSQAKVMQQQQQLGIDEKAYRDSLDNFVIKKPTKLNIATKLNRSIKRITCGRMHYAALIRVANGAHSFVESGLSVYPSALIVEAGKLVNFAIRVADEDGNLTVGGDEVKVDVTSDNVAYEKQLLKLNLKDYKGFEVVDSCDGRYTASGFLPLIGDYYFEISINGTITKDSPFRVSVKPANIHPPKCFCWFGIYAKASTAVNRHLTSGYGTELVAFDKEEIVFTVSLRDAFGNYPPSVSTAGAYVVVTIEALDGDIATMSNYIDTPDRLDISVVPCTIKTPTCVGEYLMKVAIVVRSGPKSSDNLVNRNFTSDKDKYKDAAAGIPVMGSPFKLTIISKPVQSNPVDDNGDVSKSGLLDVEVNGTKDEVRQDTIDEQEDEAVVARVLEVSKAEATRRRAELALRQHQLHLAKAKEDKKKSMAKRIGGGFMIQYSKEI